MQARDATGRQVSLLNDDSYSRPLTYRTTSQYQSTRGISPPSHTPELMRSDSYDSNTSYDPVSPMTPAVYDFSRAPYDDYLAEKQSTLKRPAYVDSSRSNSFLDEDSSNTSSVPDRTAKRYPCRYRDSHGCEKTFTTSGHASRHSKIHTAEKAVQCTFPGCHKKFTRADNMKQHLETHFKDKSRSSGSTKSSKSLGSSKRGSISSRSTTSQGSSQASQDVTMWDADHYGIVTEVSQLPSPSGWDMRGLSLPIMSRPGAMRASSGLDALAAIACQEGSA
ncbi:hypothetical protein JX265_005327 [Neoarthrinium moseri]|uniref:C2H2-type domain-containing protein n=1 Tax=Neoarthrinium moseri TaxID=1658444 RepID=A0A9P9WP14_9PEZI|nr:uncharacterized protein JN550_006216 [Neoarthrinium moseri]KAI1845637.1 hypothetical protein JX266_008248 [Neoarthrinium moseri]KAI1868641.1 hypothetical protein JN550_006216 [Neoarthrinium moseri]KAI1872447.1 hypothetical protein JX265_005327 [Neoarthrinium moseri]